MISLKKLFTPVKSIGADEAKSLIAGKEEGAYTLLDVRQPAEYEAEHIPGARLIPLPDLNLDLVRGDETPSEMIALAYGMEMGLGIVYGEMAERSDDSELKSLLTQLADIETRHKKRLLEMLAEIDTPITDTDVYEADLQSSNSWRPRATPPNQNRSTRRTRSAKAPAEAGARSYSSRISRLVREGASGCKRPRWSMARCNRRWAASP